MAVAQWKVPDDYSYIGALKFKINQLSGWRFGEPTINEVRYYSDIVKNGGIRTYWDLTLLNKDPYLFVDGDTKNNPDKLLCQYVYRSFIGDNEMTPRWMTADDVAAENYYILHPWFAWSAPLPNAVNGIVTRARVKSNTLPVLCIPPNPFRLEIMKNNLITLGKLALIFGVLPYATYKGIRMYRRR